MKNLRAFVLCFFPIVLGLLAAEGCKKEPPVKPEISERVKLTLIDVAVKEAYLHITVSSPAANETLSLQRNGTTVMTFAAVADTSIADTALAQTTPYVYTATVQTNTLTGKSNTITAQTLAPTSHGFTWETVLLGDGNGSALYDVALINDTLAYAVGEIYLSGDPTRYNAAIWNGDSWTIQRIPYYYQGQPFYNPIQTVFAFSHDDIWFAGNGLVHWNGQQYIPVDVSSVWGPYPINRIWGDAGEIWIVGEGGSIAHRNVSGTWRRLESGTTTSILDAWGIVNPVSTATAVYCVASNIFGNGDTKILKITAGTHVDSLQWIGRLLTGVWTHSGFPLHMSGDGVFENARGEWREVPTGVYTNDIRGTSLNNIVAVGDFGFIMHFNGMDWQVVGSDATAGYATVRVRDDLVVAIGRKNARGLITIGRRQ
ncbi:hypothetical protein FBQ87_05030 [Sphingobacteriales bacterium CHB3]|nr:hypothetical protein [Sphingobacteriales bacterium CHB3]